MVKVFPDPVWPLKEKNKDQDMSGHEYLRSVLQ